jgi:hypothetical protein
MFHGGGLLDFAHPQPGGPPPVGCPRLLIQYIHSYPPYLEAVFSISNLRTRHAVVTRDPLNMARWSCGGETVGCGLLGCDAIPTYTGLPAFRGNASPHLQPFPLRHS